MNGMVQLTPEELYFLGKIMKAKYIDYSYYAAMKDIQKQFDVCERKALSALGEKGLIDENFSGEIEVPDEVSALMYPVFFGTKESRLKANQTYNFHIGPETVTMGFFNEGSITFMTISDSDLEKLLRTDCVIICADMETGYTQKQYSRVELRDDKVKEEAICILKGEQGNV